MGTNAATITLTDSPGAPVSTSVTIIPSAPTNLVVVVGAVAQKMTLSWQNNASSSTNVYVERKQGSGGSWGLLATLAPTATSYEDDTVSPNKELYVYRVYAASGGLDSPRSNEAYQVASPP